MVGGDVRVVRAIGFVAREAMRGDGSDRPGALQQDAGCSSARLLDPEGYLREVLCHIAGDPINRIDKSLPWNIRRAVVPIAVVPRPPRPESPARASPARPSPLSAPGWPSKPAWLPSPTSARAPCTSFALAVHPQHPAAGCGLQVPDLSPDEHCWPQAGGRSKHAPPPYPPVRPRVAGLVEVGNQRLPGRRRKRPRPHILALPLRVVAQLRVHLPPRMAPRTAPAPATQTANARPPAPARFRTVSAPSVVKAGGWPPTMAGGWTKVPQASMTRATSDGRIWWSLMAYLR